MFDSEAIKLIGTCFAGLLIGVAIWQIRKIRGLLVCLEHSKYPKKWIRFFKRQSYRRLQIHFLLGSAGGMMFIGLYLPPLQWPLLWGIVWLAVIGLICGAILLASIDYIALTLFYRRADPDDQ